MPPDGHRRAGHRRAVVVAPEGRAARVLSAQRAGRSVGAHRRRVTRPGGTGTEAGERQGRSGRRDGTGGDGAPAVDAAGRSHPPRENRPAAPEWPRPGRSVRGPGRRPPQDRDPGARRPGPPFEPSSAAASLRPAAGPLRVRAPAGPPPPGAADGRTPPAPTRTTPRGPGLWPAAGPSVSPPCQDHPGHGDDVRRRVCVVAGFRHRRRTAGTVPGSDGKGGSRCWQR